MTFDGFISYSHAADGRLAPAVQRGLHRLAKPWHRRRALWIFRDQTGLAVTPGLWSSIQTALDGSEYFVLLASPEAAHSPWVNREIEHWITTKSADRILPVVTDGTWAWDPELGDFTEDSTAVPAALSGVFTEEPFFLDLRWARGSEHLSLQHTRFRDAIAQLAAPMHGVSKDELEGEDVRQHRRARRWRAGAAATLAVLAVLATATGVSAVRNADRARAAAEEAVRQQKAAEVQRGSAERSAAEARRQQQLARREQERARREQDRAADATGAADRAERLAQEKQELADQATVEAQRQQRLADEAAARTREQQRRAREAAARAERLQKEAEKQARIAREQRQRTREAAAEAARQQARAEQQQRIAVSRRLLNQARGAAGTDPQTAFMLGAAAQAVEPGTGTRRELAGMLTSAPYVGSVSDVTNAVYGPDGALAVADRDGRVSLWNVADPNRPVRLSTLTDPTRSGSPLLFSRNGTLAFIDAHDTAVLWKVAGSSRPVRVGPVPAGGRVTAIALSWDGSTLAAGLGNRDLEVWNVAGPTPPTRLSTVVVDDPTYDPDEPIPPGSGLLKGPAKRLALSPDGRMLAVDRLRGVECFDLTDRANPVNRYRSLGVQAHSGAMAFSPDGTWFASGTPDGSVVLRDVTGRTLSEEEMSLAAEPVPTISLRSPPAEPPFYPEVQEYWLKGLRGTVHSIAFSADGHRLVAGDEQGNAMVWEAVYESTPVRVTSVQTHDGITAATFAPAGDRVVTVDSSAAAFWAVPPHGRPNQVAALGVPGTRVAAAAFDPNGRSLVAAGADGTALTWQVTDPRRPVAGAVRTLHAGKVRAVAFSPDHRAVATVGDDGRLTLADTGSPQKAVTVATVPGDTASLEFSSDGRTLAVVAGSDRLILFDVADRRRPAQLATLSGVGFSGAMAFSPDGRTLAAGGDKNPRLTLWDVTDRARPHRLAGVAGHSKAVEAVAFSPDGRMLASGSDDDTTVLWDVTDRVRPHRLTMLTGLGAEVSALTFHRDRRTLAVSGGTTVLLWDVDTPAAPLLLASVPTGYGAAAAAFSRDGHTMAVTGQVGDRGTVTLWDYRRLSTLRADPARSACALAGRGLTASEWARYIPELRYRRSC